MENAKTSVSFGFGAGLRIFKNIFELFSDVSTKAAFVAALL